MAADQLPDMPLIYNRTAAPVVVIINMMALGRHVSRAAEAMSDATSVLLQRVEYDLAD